MKSIRWILAGIFLVAAALIVPTTVVLADAYGLDATREAAEILPDKVAGASTIPEIIGNIVKIGLSFLGIIFFLLVLYAGVRWMVARGNTEEVTKAKDILEAALVGLLLVLGAYAISSFVFSSLAGKGTAPGGGAAPAAAACDNCRKACILEKCAAKCTKPELLPGKFTQDPDCAKCVSDNNTAVEACGKNCVTNGACSK